jgi:ABC-type multidrug transport system ATPase subunit
MHHLSIQNLSKTYPNGVRAINNISLEIGTGMFGLLGPNGAGKSSLMKTIVGLQKADDGQIQFNGTDVLKDATVIKQQLGFLPQDFGVYPKTSAYDLLNHLAILKGVMNAAERKEQVLALLEKVNLYQHRKKEVHTFSGGMRQRFGVAQALLGKPRIVIVDEPTAGLDPEERNRFNSLLSEIGEDIIVILSTHLVEDVHNLCAEMAIINDGTVLAHAKPEELVSQLHGRIWQKQVTRAELDSYSKDHQVISSRFIAGKMSIRLLGEDVPEGFEAVSPTLEDVYFTTLKQDRS